MDNQRILAIETSSPRLSLAIGTGQKVIREYNGPLAWRHAESLFEGMSRLLSLAKWPVQSLTGVVVSTGPGSFTGIRIGLAAARTLGQALKIPVAGVSSLETIACERLEPGKRVCPVIDALRGEIFTALYELTPAGKKKVIWKECRMPAGDLGPRLRAFPSTTIVRDAAPRAGILLKIGRDRLRRSPQSYERVLPLYLRTAAAAERREIQSKN